MSLLLLTLCTSALYGWSAWRLRRAPGDPWLRGLLPLALPGFAVMRVPGLYRHLWPVGQRALGVAEAGLPGEWLAETHEYGLE